MKGMGLQGRGFGWGSRQSKLEVLAEEGVEAVEHSVCCTGGKWLDQSEPEAVAGFEAGLRTAPSGCGMVSPEAEVSESEEGRDPGSGPARRVVGLHESLLGSKELV